MKRLTMKGLLVLDWLNRQGEFEQEVGGYYRAGKLKNKEMVVNGTATGIYSRTLQIPRPKAVEDNRSPRRCRAL